MSNSKKTTSKKDQTQSVYQLSSLEPTLKDVEGIVAKYPQLRPAWQLINNQLASLEEDYTGLVTFHTITRYGYVPVQTSESQWRDIVIGNIFDVFYHHIANNDILPTTYMDWLAAMLVQYEANLQAS